MHQVDQALADDQAEAGSAVDTRGRGVCLGERLEQLGRGFGRQADAGIAHGEGYFVVAARFAALADLDGDTAAFGELDRVADQVGQDLAQAHRIATHGEAHRWIDDHAEAQTLGGRAAFHQGRHRIDEVLQVDSDALEFELARLELGVVEDVVDDAQQLQRRLVRGRQVVALVGAQRRRAHQFEQRHDAVQRRADLVAHGGEELALGHRGGFGLLLGGDQLALHRAQGFELAQDRGRHLGLAARRGGRERQHFGAAMGQDQRDNGRAGDEGRGGGEAAEQKGERERRPQDQGEAGRQRGQGHGRNQPERPAARGHRCRNGVDRGGSLHRSVQPLDVWKS